MVRRRRKRRFRKTIILAIILFTIIKMYGLIGNGVSTIYDDNQKSCSPEEAYPTESYEEDETDLQDSNTEPLIPEGYELIICDVDYESEESSIERVIDKMMTGMCLVNGTVTMNSLRRLAYNSYWVDHLEVRIENEFNPVTGEDDTYNYYSIYYKDISNV